MISVGRVVYDGTLLGLTVKPNLSAFDNEPLNLEALVRLRLERLGLGNSEGDAQGGPEPGTGMTEVGRKGEPSVELFQPSVAAWADDSGATRPASMTTWLALCLRGVLQVIVMQECKLRTGSPSQTSVCAAMLATTTLFVRPRTT